MSDNVVDPLLTRSFNSWKKSFSFKHITIWSTMVGLSVIGYLASSTNEWKFVFVFALSMIIVFMFRLPSLIAHMVGEIKKESVVLWLMWIVSVILLKRVGWFAENIDGGTALFLVYLPAIWLFDIPRAVNGFLAILIIPFLPFFLKFGMERTAEIWAVVFYFMLVVTVIQMMKEVRDDDGNN